MSSWTDMTVSVKTLAEVAFVSAVVYAVVSVSKSASVPRQPTGQGSAGSSKTKRKQNKNKVKRQEPNGLQQSVYSGNDPVDTAKRVSDEASAPADKVQKPNIKSKPSKPARKAGDETAAEAQPSKESGTRNVETVATQVQQGEPPRLTAAEKFHKPAPPTATDDMRDKDIDPDVKVARVMKLVGGKAGSRPKPDASTDDDEFEWQRVGGWDDEADEPEGQWQTATSAVKKSNKSGTSSPFSLSNPSPARTVPGLTASAQASLTKKQRENQSRAAKAAQAKQEAEQDRLARLAQHRKGLEKIRMAEQERERNRGKPKSGPRSEHFGTPTSAANNRTLSGGMSASVNSNGKLIWD
ncbi:hypothetical protein OIV83_003552 [Microbotryomycetes sp. JL201]|nr:hypothetical protein OIV83_003552 [Microbotryomycetes sp. JL201]